MDLATSVSQLNRVGKVLEKKLNYLGIETVDDLLNYYPFRYEDFSEICDIANLQEGTEVTVRAKIELIANKRSPRKRKIITEAIVNDGTDSLRIVWFGQPFITKILAVRDEVFFSGKVKNDMFGMQMVGPAYEKATNNTTHTARIVPIYSLTSGITQKQIRFLMSQVIDLSRDIKDWLPENIRDQVDVMELPEAMKAIHFPESNDELRHAERRLKFDELFLLQLRAEMIRQSIKRSTAPKIKFDEKKIKKFVRGLPFELTKDQKISAWEIIQDMEKDEPMNRLLEGDVGSGKTVVSAMALYDCVLSGYQGVLMAPTEILAFQHFQSLGALLPDLEIILLTGSKIEDRRLRIIAKSKNRRRDEAISFIKNGEVNIIIGTHSLLTDDVLFKDLGLLVVDEQHRFGVKQRKKILEKSGNKKTTPHFLSMTATPIPRSFALTVYGDLDLSIIREMPAGRKAVKTRLVDPHNREKAYGFILEQVKCGRQVFVVCSLIQEKEKATDYGLRTRVIVDKKSVLVEYEKLSKYIFPDLKVDFLHGKLKPEEKNETMAKFKNGEIDILVSTSVVEVGVDIPNASVMMIEGAENFGLAQLHQFRGRVGRSEHQSYCFLFTDSDSKSVQERLTYFEKNNSGFDVAEYDLEIRGPGEVYGTNQSGMEQLRLATMHDRDLIKIGRDVARGIDFDKYVGLKKKVEEWELNIHLE